MLAEFVKEMVHGHADSNVTEDAPMKEQPATKSMKNLAGDPVHASRKKALGKELRRWMKDEGDPGIALDTIKAFSAAREGKHLF